MATLVLQGAGMAIGSAMGGPIGALAGRVIGGLAGAIIDQALLAPSPTRREGPRLGDLNGVTSTEGAPIPRVYGRARIGGQIIWATPFEEETHVEQSGGFGGKGGAGASQSTTYSYFANLAIALCEGEIALVRRVWADGKEVDLLTLDMRVHKGGQTQMPDPLIAAHQGGSNAPAYRGTAYVVIERLALEPYGNRVPQFTFEVIRPIVPLVRMIRGVDLIPGASEFAYETHLVRSLPEAGTSRAENRHQLMRTTDLAASLDTLQALCPALTSVALVVSWFGDDLRCGFCSVAPRVENHDKVTDTPWSVAGLTRNEARIVSQVDGRPAYGGTPSDDSIRNAIAELKARGLSVVFYPFVMMDIPSDNALPDPWSSSNSQKAFPWRGRITCDPAPGVAGSPDGSARAGDEVEHFFGSVDPAEDEWSFRRFILHYARLCAEAGGVDAFLIGSEFASLTRVRSATGVYPAAAGLAQLAADAKAILGSATKISYAADWTEYGAHVRNGGAEVRFPLDSLWASPAVDFIGIDAYWPLSDWRDGDDHADRALSNSLHDTDYLRSRMNAGEGYEWFYPDSAARAAQARLPITDGAYGKPWIFRQKDLVNWWSQPHVERTGGVELSSPTPYVPMGKPIWLTEIGCPAVDRGSNAPNVFPDPKSSDGGLPYFSSGRRDDLIQLLTLEAMITHFQSGTPSFVESNNPVSPIYGGRMVDVARIHAWAWDARPFPAFPAYSDVWSDAANWPGGHWLGGRTEGAPLDALIAAILADWGLAADVKLEAHLSGMIDGYVVDRRMSPRDALEPLTTMAGIDISMNGNVLLCRDLPPEPTDIAPDDLVVDERRGPLVRRRQNDGESPAQMTLTFTDAEGDYHRAAAASRRLEQGGGRISQADLAAIMRRGVAATFAERWLRRASAARETAEFTLSPRHMCVEVGDVLRLEGERWRVDRVSDAAGRAVAATRLAQDHARVFVADPPPLVQSAPPIAGPALVHLLELGVSDGSNEHLLHVAAHADPWPGRLGVWAEKGEAAFDLIATIERPARIGTTMSGLAAGPLARWDNAGSVDVRMSRGALASVGDMEVLGGANRAAIKHVDGSWEIIAFARAELIGARTFRLSRLLRGLGAEDFLASRPLSAGAAFVVLDEAVKPLPVGPASLGHETRLRIGPARQGHGGDAVAAASLLVRGKALRPLSPVHLRARRIDGGIEIEFIRRGRVLADGWEQVDIPLGEDQPRFDVSIWQGGTLKRSISTASSTALYPDADEATDFGGPQDSLDIEVVQMSGIVGAGHARRDIVAISH